MGLYTSFLRAGKGSSSFLIYVLFNLYEGVNTKEYCQAPEGGIECATGCCGDHWKNNVSCCPFHPAAFIMIVMAIALAIVFIGYCVISSMKRWNRTKTVIKPQVSTEPKHVSFVSYVLVAPGVLKKYPTNHPPPYLQEWGVNNTDTPPTYSDDRNYLPR